MVFIYKPMSSKNEGKKHLKIIYRNIKYPAPNKARFMSDIKPEITKCAKK